MNRAFVELNSTLLLSLAAPASAQISVQDTTHHVTFCDLQLVVPGSRWAHASQSKDQLKRLTPSNSLGLARCTRRCSR